MVTNKFLSKNPVLSKSGALMLAIYMVAASFAGVAFPMTASALDTGFKSPTADDAFGSGWSSEANAYSSNNVYTTSSTEGSEQSYESFNFGVPSGATITGLQMTIEGMSSDTSGCSIYAQMWSTSDFEHTHAKSAALTGADTVHTLGADGDLWGSTWTATDFSNGNFHMEMWFNDTSGNNCQSSTVSVDHVQVKVFYTESEPTVGDYAITAVQNVVGQTLNLTGTASGNPFVGQLNDQHISIDWNEDQNLATENYVTEDSDSSGNDAGVQSDILFDIDSYDASGNDKFFTENNWTASHTYPAAGSYTITIKVHHANTNGAEGSDAATIQLDIVIPPSTGGITVTKTTTGGDGTFDFLGNNGIGAFQITTVGGIGTKEIYNLVPTAYTITETVPEGWAQNSETCSSVAVTAGATSTCSVANTKKATVNVVKTVVNDNGGTAVAADFTMNVTGTNASQTSFAGNSSGVAVTMDAGAFSVSETASSTYTMSTSGECSGTIAAGETKTCAIINDDIAPSLTLNKVVNGDEDGGPSEASAWTLLADGTGSNDLMGSGPTVTSDSTFKAGLYQLSEDGPTANYTASGWVCNAGTQDGSNLYIALGQTVSCTITNTYTTPTPGTITIVKNTFGGDGTFSFEGSTGIGNFQLTTTGGTASQVFAGLESEGTYSLTEVSQPGWVLTSSVCTGEMGTSSIYLAPGASVTCTITNTKLGHIIIQKETSPDGAEVSFDFTASYDQDGFTLSDGQSNDSGELMPGTYSVSEDEIVQGNWEFTSATCSDGSPIDAISLQAGETVTCTFTNSSTLADVSIEKTVDDASPEINQSIVFTITVANAGPHAVSSLMVSDLLPSAFTYDSDNGSGAYDSNTGIWTVGSLANGATKSLEITAHVGYGAGSGTATNVATISDSSNPDVNDDNDSDSVIVELPGQPQCSDGIDNDDDGDTDYGDEGDSNCSGPDDNTEQNPACSDGIDNDKDGYTDYQSEGGDIGCTGSDDESEQNPQCSDGIDNDEDGSTDYGEEGDVNCSSPTDDNESSEGPQCSDGIDNDGDGSHQVDTTDPGCHTDNNPWDPATYDPTDNDETNGQTPTNNGGGGGGGNGPIFGGSFGNGPVGQVLGASTTLPELPAGCSALLHTFMRQGRRANDANEVKLLQTFLNNYMQAGLPVTGSFGPQTKKAVDAFQVKHTDQVLTPWNLSAPTGFVYLTTQRWINLVHCSTLNLPIPELVPFQGE